MIVARISATAEKRLRPDSNRGWWICNPQGENGNSNPENYLESRETPSYRVSYRSGPEEADSLDEPDLIPWNTTLNLDAIEDDTVDRRLSCDPALRQLALLWPELSADAQGAILRRVKELL